MALSYRLSRSCLSPICLLLILTAVLQGCGGDGQAPGAATAVRGEEALASCPGADLAGSKTLVYVATSGADSDSCGDKPATACASIGKGIARCAVAGCAVVVQHGLYSTSASISLRDAVSVHGSCRFGDEPERYYRTVIAAAPAAGMPAIDGAGINSATLLSGIVVLGKNETAAGEASIAMRVRASKGLALQGVTLAAGRGGDGAAGASGNGGPGGAGRAPDSQNSVGYGGQACPANPPPSGGDGGMGRVINQFTVRNCVFDCDCFAVPPDQQPADTAGKDAGHARGGASSANGSMGGNCSTRPNLTPGPGGAGLPGEIGDCSAAGGTAALASTGGFAGGRWLAASGGQGGRGGTGSGGGGGGAGGFSVYIPVVGPIETYPGYAGSGGGGGGCGAPGGQGGQQGGASIALVLIDATLPGVAAGSLLVPGPGGNGGAGGIGGIGGPGGNGAAANNPPKVTRQYGFINIAMPGFGNAGGNGGDGGASAGGAGGNGGPAIGVALLGNSPDPGPTGAYAGTPGAPGKHGAGQANPVAPGNVNSQCRSADGQEGLPGIAAPLVRYTEAS
jgi:hypothetical protein